jgi:uncharacterized protein YecE (DUF72 family)
MVMVRIGTCSWKYPSWDKLVYPSPRGIDYLAHYSRKYATVEVDQWFWSLFANGIKLPNPKDVAAYRTAVGDEFSFSVKAPNSITLTHYYKKKKSDTLTPNPRFLSSELLANFLTLLAPLHDVLGPVMFQFEYLNRQKMASQKQFQQLLAEFFSAAPPNFQYGLEIRNQNYLNRAWFEFLAAHNLIPVLIQGYWMPSVIEIFRKYRSQLTAFPTMVIRLHGPGRQEMEKLTQKRWNQIVAPKDEELDAVVAMVEDLTNHGADVYINVNNHYEGSAPLTITRFNQRLAQGLQAH